MSLQRAQFIGCVACGRYEEDDGRPGPMLMCCGIPMYGETIPVVAGNRPEVLAAKKRAREWKRSRAPRRPRDGRGTP